MVSLYCGMLVIAYGFLPGPHMKTLNLPSFLYIAHIPAFNPIIYTLKNKDVKR